MTNQLMMTATSKRVPMFKRLVNEPRPRQDQTETPIALLLKFQANPRSLNEHEKTELWEFFNGYVARAEKKHFGMTDHKGSFQDQRTNRIMVLWNMMLELRDAVNETYPYIEKGHIKRAKACKITAPLRHPNLILTYFSRTFPNLELIIRSRILFGVDLTVHGLTWDVNSTTTNRWSKVAAQYRKMGNKVLPLEVYNELSKRAWTLKTQRKWLRACCQYYLWLKYQPRTLSLESDTRYGGNQDRLSFTEATDVFSL